jgi:hypothetical protein
MYECGYPILHQPPNLGCPILRFSLAKGGKPQTSARAFFATDFLTLETSPRTTLTCSANS